MPEPGRQTPPSDGGEVRLEEIGHPRGTLVIVILYGILFGLGWIAIYFFRFLERGAPHA